jgi:hypothetical protein
LPSPAPRATLGGKTPDYVRANRHSIRHRDELLAGDLCGRFSCLATFPPSSVKEWADGGDTALCPGCGIDAVIGSESGYPLTEGFLRRMQAYCFAGKP